MLTAENLHFAWPATPPLFTDLSFGNEHGAIKGRVHHRAVVHGQQRYRNQPAGAKAQAAVESGKVVHLAVAA